MPERGAERAGVERVRVFHRVARRRRHLVLAQRERAVEEPKVLGEQPGREAGMDRSWDASVYNQNSMAGRIAARRLAGRSPRSPGVSTAIVPRK